MSNVDTSHQITDIDEPNYYVCNPLHAIYTKIPKKRQIINCDRQQGYTIARTTKKEFINKDFYK